MRSLTPRIIKKLLTSLLSLTVVLHTAVFGFIGTAHATLLTTMSDVMSTSNAGEESNHTFTFTTPTGASNNTTITITFPGAFGTSSLTQDDVDITDDGVERTTAANCDGVEQMSVSVLADVITLRVCAGDGGAISAGSIVVVEIGTHATASGTGVNQITNPSTAGTYLIGINGTFNDNGSLAVTINEPGSITVRAVVEGDDGGGGCVGSCSTDDEAPNIFNIQCTPSDTSLLITWDTDDNATGAVDYGLSSDYELGTVEDTNFLIEHSFTIASLTPDTTYHYHVRSADSDGNETVSPDDTCITTDETLPIISNVEVEDITVSSAVVTFSTNEDTHCTVEYGTTLALGSTETESGYDTGHAVELTGLTSDTEYFFEIHCEDQSANAADYGPDAFTTLENLPPTNSSSLSCVAGDATMDFSWNNPSDEDLAGVLLNCSTSSYPSDPEEGTNVFSGGPSSESVTISGTNGTTYYCTLFTYDEAAQFSSGATESCTPTAEEEQPECEDPSGCPPPEECTDPEGCEPPTECTDPDGCEPPTECTDPEGCGGETTTPDAEGAEFTAAEDTIDLPVDNNKEVDVIPDRPFGVFVPVESITDGAVDTVYFYFDDSSYILTPSYDDEGQLEGYRGYVMAPEEVGAYEGDVYVEFTDGTTEQIDYIVNAVPLGFVYQVIDGAVSRISGAIVTLLVSLNGVWEFADVYQFGQQDNPTVSASDGTFAWYVANGTYRVEVSKAGFEDASSGTFTVTNNIATVNVRMVEAPVPLEEILDSDLPLDEKALAILTESSQWLEHWLDELRALPELQVAIDIAVPFVIALGVIGLALLFGLFDLLPLLQYLFTSPLLFLWKRKRKAWGVVYHAGTKIPLDLAIVRLYSAVNNKLLATRVTDKNGRYFFLADPGEYRLMAVKPGFIFPSQILAGVKDDGTYMDVYHGEVIKVNEKQATIAANIPLDPADAANYHSPKGIVVKRILRKLQNTTATLGLFIALFILIIRPSLLTIFGFTLQVILYALSYRLAKARKPKSWGIVYEARSRHRLGNVVVRIFEPKYNKLLETVLTDEKGRYSFLVGPASYYTTYEKPGYQKLEIKQIDLTQAKGPGEVALDVELQKNTKPQS